MAKNDKPKEITVTLKHDRSTKGAHRYQEIDKDGKDVTTADDACIVGTLYVRKKRFGEEPLQKITMTIKAA